MAFSPDESRFENCHAADAHFGSVGLNPFHFQVFLSCRSIRIALFTFPLLMTAIQSIRPPASSPTPLLPPPASFPVLCLHAASALHRTLAAVLVFAPALAAAVGVSAYWVVDGSSWETMLPAQAIARAASDWNRMFFTVAISEVGMRFHRLRLCDAN